MTFYQILKNVLFEQQERHGQKGNNYTYKVCDFYSKFSGCKEIMTECKSVYQITTHCKENRRGNKIQLTQDSVVIGHSGDLTHASLNEPVFCFKTY